KNQSNDNGNGNGNGNGNDAARFVGAQIASSTTEHWTLTICAPGKCLANPDAKVAIHYFNSPQPTCEYRMHDSRPAQPTIVQTPFAVEAPDAVRRESAGACHPRLLGIVALPSRPPARHLAHACMTSPGLRRAV
ncbi:hypothetical protein ACR1QG_13955, partial [Pseudomonas fulva]